MRRHRNGDRRSRPRFDVVGNLAGTVETWQRFGVRNISPAGALIETTRPFAPGERLRGRVSAGGRRVQAWMGVNRSAPAAGGGGWRERAGSGEGHESGRYLVALEWSDPSSSIAELLAALDVAPDGGVVPDGGERRAMSRMRIRAPEEGPRREDGREGEAADVDLDVAFSTTVRVCDISAAGVLISSPVALPVGTRAQLRMRPGADDFAGDIEVRRLAHDDSAAEWLIGAAFVGLDDRNRHSLESLLIVRH